MGTRTIPGLFVDEVGQAVPQVAAGAIWRSKQRFVAVGDGNIWLRQSYFCKLKAFE